MTLAFPRSSWLVGCGNMGGAMVEGWRAAGVDLASVTAIRPSGTLVLGVTTVAELPDGPAPALALLGFKPQKLDEVAPELSPRLDQDSIVVSLLAGVDAATLRARFPAVRAIIRAMPNLPVAQRRGVTALYSIDKDEEALRLVEQLMAALGLAAFVDDEAQFSAIGAVAGSGPAFVARFVDALQSGGEQLGLPPDLARSIARETIIGTAAMAEATSLSMAELARRVASPKGTTEAGLAVLDGDQGIQSLVKRVLDAAIARGRAMADAARGG